MMDVEDGLAQELRNVQHPDLLRDIPGSLAGLCQDVAATRANILHIYHDRTATDIPIGNSKVVMELETSGLDQIKEIQDVLRAKGYVVELDPRCPVA